MYIKVQWLYVTWCGLELNLVAWIIQRVVVHYLMCVLQCASDPFQWLLQFAILGLIVQIEDPSQATFTNETIFWKFKIILSIIFCLNYEEKHIEMHQYHINSIKNSSLSSSIKVIPNNWNNFREIILSPKISRMDSISNDKKGIKWRKVIKMNGILLTNKSIDAKWSYNWK